MSFLIAQIINGIKIGSIYALIAIGYTMVYGILRLINFAHGDMLMIVTYTAWILMLAGIPLPAVILLSIVVTMLIALAVEHFAYRPLRGSGGETTLMTSLAVSMLLQNIVTVLFSPQSQAFKLPDIFSTQIMFGEIQISYMNVIFVAGTIISLIIVSVLVKSTRLGIAMRACSDNRDAAQLMGVNINSVIRFAFAISGVLAAIAGLMYSGEYISFNPSMGFIIGIKAFVAAVIGGIGSITGAALGGFLLGLLEMLLAGYLPSGFTAYRTALVFLTLILVLLVRPNGLLGTSDERRS